MKKSILAMVAVTCVAFMVGAGNIQAAPIQYDEFSYGDLDGLTFAFDIGENVVTGNMTTYIDCAFAGCIKVLDDADIFKFTLPVATQLSGVSIVATSNYLPASFDFFEAGLGTVAIPATTDTDPLGGLLPLTGDLFRISHPGSSDLCYQTFGICTFSLDYEWRFLVETATAAPAVIPLPAAAWMFLTALGGLGLFGWRRRRAAA